MYPSLTQPHLQSKKINTKRALLSPTPETTPKTKTQKLKQKNLRTKKNQNKAFPLKGQRHRPKKSWADKNSVNPKALAPAST